MDGSNGKIIDLLERIAVGQEATRQEMRQLREDMNAGFAKVDARFETVTTRVDHLVSFAGAHHADHERRITVLEERVSKKSG